MIDNRLSSIFQPLDCALPPQDAHGLAVTSPCDGSLIAQLATDTLETLNTKISRSVETQRKWQNLGRDQRAQHLENLSAAIRKQRESLAALITLDGGKTNKEALGEADGSANIILKTIKDAALTELNDMLRCKERPPVGIIGLITSFNFPLVVANWTIAPAMLAANALLWKPSEKTPLVAFAYKAIFDTAMGEFGDLLQLVIGGRDIGEALVAHEQVDMISATGSVAMGQGIKTTLAKKKNASIRPILELGGNNAVIMSQKMSQAHLEWSIHALLNSFFGTSGQRCTNTRRLIVHRQHYMKVEALLKQHIESFLKSNVTQNPLSGASNDFGYGPLIDSDAFARFEHAKKRVGEEGGSMLFGGRILEAQYPQAYYVEPALALLPTQSAVMLEETFAPLLYILPYEGSIDEAIALANAPNNAGLVNGLYTQNQPEANRFASLNQAGHSVINSPKGTGTPAFDMGFGGNKASGEGEILNSADPLAAFTRAGSYSRIAQNQAVVMNYD